MGAASRGGRGEQVLAALERLRWTFRWKADGLPAAALCLRIGRSSLTLGRLLKHLAVVEDQTFRSKLADEPMPSALAGQRLGRG
ncbi:MULTISPECIES: DUF664 domain-containing protein [unclassified Knoellia]|uniref:mycothiol transferase n=1 Tax=Knoellia altitudinis TaxID=3404795 RepID=UPI0036214AEA